jgi:hypothetical protein
MGGIGMIGTVALLIRELYNEGFEIELRYIYLLSAAFIGALALIVYGATL